MAKALRVLIVLGMLAAASFTMVQAASAKPSDGTRPGWGFGDKNHVHTGPPGHSVHPHP